MKGRNLILTIIICLPSLLRAQDNPLAVLQRNEKDLAQRFDSLYLSEDPSVMDSLNRAILNEFAGFLSTPEGYYYRWQLLPRMGKVYAEDDKLRIFTWYLPGRDGSYRYYGLLCSRKEGRRKKDPVTFNVVRLEDDSENIPEPENAVLSAASWYGSVYYALKPFSYRRNTWYALIGYDFNDPYSDKKVIEILQFDEGSNPVFGGEFNLGNKKMKRVIFEYSSEVAMFLNYDPRLNRIVFDHLRPFEPILAGNYRFYGPDGSYDAFRFEKGSFILEEDVDARNE